MMTVNRVIGDDEKTPEKAHEEAHRHETLEGLGEKRREGSL